MIVPTHLSERDPHRLAVQVLSDCDVVRPPIDEQRMLEYFEIEITRRSFSEMPGCMHLVRERKGAPSGMLIKDEDDGPPLVWVDPDVTRGRYRWTVFHELGHHHLGHEGDRFTDNDRTLRTAEGRSELMPTKYREAARQGVLPGITELPNGAVTPLVEETTDSARRKLEEREANLYASEMIMPSQLFAPEARRMPTGIETIQQLREEYQTSFEATAIRYAQACPEKCAVVAMEPMTGAEGSFTGFTVLYVLRASRSFLSGLHQDARLPFSGLLATAWTALDNGHVTGTVTADYFGLPSHLEIRADALRLGDYGRVLALLWLESGQLPMDFPESDS